MISKLEDTKKAEELFGDWQETMIRSCLQNVMGSIFVDNLEQPHSAMAFLGDFCFLAGEPLTELALYKPADSGEFMILVPQNEQWETLIVASYHEKAKKITRYAIQKEDGVFNHEALQQAVDSLAAGYSMQLIDERLYQECKGNGWSQDLVSQFADYERYQQLGLGVVVLKDGEIVAGASSYTRYKSGIEVEIDTMKEYRRNGLAYVCGARLILECLSRGLYPSWDAHNQGSVALAEKLGYHFSHEYTAFEILA